MKMHMKMHMGNKWNVPAWLVIAAALAVPFSGMCFAAEEDTSHYSDDRHLAYIGITLAAKTAANAVDLLADGERDPDYFLKGFSGIHYSDPDKLITVHFDPVQSRLAREALGVDSNQLIAPALAEYINVQFSEEYTEQAARVIPEPYRGDDIGETDLVILPYGSDIEIFCAGQSALIISTPEISSELSREDVLAYTEQLGIEDAEIRLYEKEDIEKLDLANNWGGSGYEPSLCNCLIASQDHFDALFPEIIDSPNVNSSECVSILYYYLKQGPSLDQVHAAAETYLPAIAAARGFESTYDCLDGSCDSISDNDFEHAEPVAFDFGENTETRTFTSDDTFLFVVRRGYADEEIEGVPAEHEDAEEMKVPVQDLISEAFLPAQAIPESLEDTDYIILCDITWGPEYYKANGHTLIYPAVHVSIYDTKTGMMVRDLGTETRKLEGLTMVSNEIVYYVPLRSLIFEQLKPVLEEIGQ